jgi:fibronectin type 3 domain-containing protein
MKKLILYLIALLLITGCAVNSKPAPKSNPNLPKVSKFNAYPDRNAMALKWNVVNGISGYYIQKFDKKEHKWKMLATINDPFKSLYIDTNLKPSTEYMYRIATFNKDKIPSLAMEIKKRTLPTITPVIPLEIKPLKKGMVKIIFRPHQNERVQGYILQRLDDKKIKWITLANLTPRYNVEYIDRGLEDGKIYQYRIIAYTYDGLKSAPSDVLKVSTYPKPPIVMNVKATNNLPRKIVLTWSPIKGAKYYKIYTRSFLGFGFTPIAKVKGTTYTDNVGKDGVKKYYKVTAVSIHDTESLLDNSPEVMGETLPVPAKPLVSTNILNNGVEFMFSSPDDRAVKYLVVKKEGNLFNAKEFKYIVKGNRFLDTNVAHKHSYTYKIYAVDKYGLISKANEVEVDF